MIEAHITDFRGAYVRTVEIDEAGPQPAGAKYGPLPLAVEGCGLAWRGGWVQVPNDGLNPPRAPLLVSADQLRTDLTTEYERRMQAIAAGYPPSERESWPVQTSEAAALIADPEASTPWIDAAATARNIDRIELAQRIVAKDAMYRVISGTLSGVRQRIEDAIDAAAGDAQALQAIDVTAGWPKGT